MTGRLQRWTTEELAILHRMSADGASHVEIAAALSTTKERVKARTCWEGKDEQWRIKRREGINAARHRRAGRQVALTAGPIFGAKATTASRPAPEMFAEARKRSEAPRTISQALLGDPPPGYSALDRKRQGISGPAHLDRRQLQLQRVPSLAGQ